MNKIIFETLTGSHLYGTNRPDSDLDYTGVFMPETRDLLGLTPGPQEMSLGSKISDGPRNTKGDVDRKLYSLPKFLKLACDGQSGMLEMLFSPINLWQNETDEWGRIWFDRYMFLSQNSITPFIGFATAQAHKATLKAGNLNHIRKLIGYINKERLVAKVLHIEDVVKDSHFGDVPVDIVEVDYRPGVKMKCVKVAGRKFEFTQSVKHFLSKLKEYEARYGTRSQAAAEEGQDYKSLMHAYRLIYQAEDILREGKLILPFDKKRIKFLMSVRDGSYQTDYYKEIEERIAQVKSIKSDLPKEVNRSKVDSLCQEILLNYIKESNG